MIRMIITVKETDDGFAQSIEHDPSAPWEKGTYGERVQVTAMFSAIKQYGDVMNEMGGDGSRSITVEEVESEFAARLRKQMFGGGI